MYNDDLAAFILANVCGFNPPRKTNPASDRVQYAGKYEPDHNPEAESRVMLLAGYHDGTNILIKYNQTELLNSI